LTCPWRDTVRGLMGSRLGYDETLTRQAWACKSRL